MREAFDVLIIGAGFSGLAMGVALRKAGIESFLIVEKATEAGGTWQENRYPGCACDVPSHLYSFSFDLNPNWSRIYATQPEIWQYLKDSVLRFELGANIRLGTAVQQSLWHEEQARWEVTLDDGSTLWTRILISGIGALHVPRFPTIPGIDTFTGPAFHSAQWRPDVPLAGKRVAVIGTGASAVQFIPQIAPATARLTVFQRTPNWILPKPDRAIPASWKWAFRHIPGLMRLYRWALFWNLEMRVSGFLAPNFLRRLGTDMARHHLHRQITDPALRAQLTPDYEFGCKRVLISSDYYPALARPNVRLVTTPITKILPHAVVTDDGAEHPADVLIYGTGFAVTETLRRIPIRGRDGIDLQHAWSERVSAFLGITVTGFPNLFLLLGPNTGLGHNSVVLMIEAQVAHVMRCLQWMRSQNQSILEVRQQAQTNFVAEIRRRLAPTVWQSGGCNSWYMDGNTGESAVLWPGSVVEYQRRTARLDKGDYELRTPLHSGGYSDKV